MNRDNVDLEMHLPGMNFCGPFTNLKNRLNSDGTPKITSYPVDRIDEAALRHDKFYSKFTSVRKRMEADKQMITEIKSISNLTCRERIEKRIVIICLSIKIFFSKCYLYCSGK